MWKTHIVFLSLSIAFIFGRIKTWKKLWFSGHPLSFNFIWGKKLASNITHRFRKLFDNCGIPFSLRFSSYLNIWDPHPWSRKFWSFPAPSIDSSDIKKIYDAKQRLHLKAMTCRVIISQARQRLRRQSTHKPQKAGECFSRQENMRKVKITLN